MPLPYAVGPAAGSQCCPTCSECAGERHCSSAHLQTCRAADVLNTSSTVSGSGCHGVCPRCSGCSETGPTLPPADTPAPSASLPLGRLMPLRWRCRLANSVTAPDFTPTLAHILQLILVPSDFFGYLFIVVHGCSGGKQLLPLAGSAMQQCATHGQFAGSICSQQLPCVWAVPCCSRNEVGHKGGRGVPCT
jgi:hypothetical protein